MKWTLPVVCLATLLNVGLWLWSPRAVGSRQPPANNQQTGAAAPAQAFATAVHCPVPVQSTSSAPGSKAPAAPSANEVDQPWLNTVRDSVMQLSMSPKFANKVTVTKAECIGSKCEIEGSTKQAANGQWYGSSDVASLMNTMNDGSIAGGDSGRLVLLNQIKASTNSDGMDFIMTVEGHEGPPPRNPCQSVFDQWKTMHPEDFKEKNPFDSKGQ